MDYICFSGEANKNIFLTPPTGSRGNRNRFSIADPRGQLNICSLPHSQPTQNFANQKKFCIFDKILYMTKPKSKTTQTYSGRSIAEQILEGT